MSHDDKTVIWATDGFDRAEAALAEARSLLPRSRFVAVHCDQRMSGRGGSYPVLADETDLKNKLETTVEALRRENLDIELVLRSGRESPADAVAAVAEERDADTIVCGTRGHGTLGGALLRSVAQRLLHVAPCPVVVVPERTAARRQAKP